MAMLKIVRKIGGDNRYPGTAVYETVKYATVDDDLLPLLERIIWTVGSDGRPKASIGRTPIYLHQKVWKLSGRILQPRERLHFRNGDFTDCRIENIYSDRPEQFRPKLQISSPNPLNLPRKTGPRRRTLCLSD